MKISVDVEIFDDPIYCERHPENILCHFLICGECQLFRDKPKQVPREFIMKTPTCKFKYAMGSDDGKEFLSQVKEKFEDIIERMDGAFYNPGGK